MTQIMQTSAQFTFQQQQQQQQYCFSAGSPTSTLQSHHDHGAITAATTDDKSTTTPKGGGCLGKTIRRRSRASKKTPITLLNADVKDFRALVQRFTGCRPSDISFARKGPVNLNFAASQQHNHYDFLIPTSEIGFHSDHTHQAEAAAAAAAAADGGRQHVPYIHNSFNGRSETGQDLYQSGHGDRDQEHHEHMFALNYMQAADFHSLDDMDLRLDDVGTSLHDLIGDINAN